MGIIKRYKNTLIVGTLVVINALFLLSLVLSND